MAEFSFYSSTIARAPLLEQIRTELGCRFLLSKNYEQPQGNELESFDAAALAWLDVNPRVYLVGRFVSHVAFNEMQSGAYDGTYVINPLIGGPLISLHLPKEVLRDGRSVLLPWVLSIAADFRCNRESQPERIPTVAKETYQEIARIIKASSKRVSLGKTRVWIFNASSVEQRLERGEVGLLHNGRAVFRSEGDRP